MPCLHMDLPYLDMLHSLHEQWLQGVSACCALSADGSHDVHGAMLHCAALCLQATLQPSQQLCWVLLLLLLGVQPPWLAVDELCRCCTHAATSAYAGARCKLHRNDTAVSWSSPLNVWRCAGQSGCA